MAQHAWSNEQIVALLKRIGDMLAILGEDRFRVQAYYRAADSIATLGREVEEFWIAGLLREIPGVGEALAGKLDELLGTGHLVYYERLQAQVPSGVMELLTIPDVGPKTARLLWQKAGLESVAEVKRAAECGELRSLPGLGARSESRILAGVQALLENGDQSI